MICCICKKKLFHNKETHIYFRGRCRCKTYQFMHETCMNNNKDYKCVECKYLIIDIRSVLPLSYNQHQKRISYLPHNRSSTYALDDVFCTNLQ